LHEASRGTCVALKVAIAVQGVSEPPKCDGETIVVNRHGALIWTSVPFLRWMFTVHARKGGAQ